MKTWIQTAIIAVMFFTAHSGAFADEPKPGDKVAAKWGTFSYYIATITNVEANGKFSVKYGDGDSGVVAPGDVEPVDPARELPIGTHVLACLNGAVMYPGTITARRDNRYTVKWEDGDAPREIERDRIAPVRPPARAMPVGALAVGTGVAAKWGQVSFYIATIEGTDASGKYLVKYGDGDHGPVAPEDVIPVSAAEPIAVGAQVLACWAGARMYSGTVTARNGDRYTVKWDDGSAPSEVARDRMAMPRREAAAAEFAPRLTIGTSVAAKWGASGSFFIATITGEGEGGKYRVEYGDGDKGDVAAGDMVPVDAKREIPIRAPVLACWLGAGMFPGTVTALTGNNYTVKWDDGSAPREVPREKIAPLPNR